MNDMISCAGLHRMAEIHKNTGGRMAILSKIHAKDKDM